MPRRPEPRPAPLPRRAASACRSDGGLAADRPRPRAQRSAALTRRRCGRITRQMAGLLGIGYGTGRPRRPSYSFRHAALSRFQKPRSTALGRQASRRTARRRSPAAVMLPPPPAIPGAAQPPPRLPRIIGLAQFRRVSLGLRLRDLRSLDLAVQSRRPPPCPAPPAPVAA